jgi:hypothetical protein
MITSSHSFRVFAFAYGTAFAVLYPRALARLRLPNDKLHGNEHMRGRHAVMHDRSKEANEPYNMKRCCSYIDRMRRGDALGVC